MKLVQNLDLHAVEPLGDDELCGKHEVVEVRLEELGIDVAADDFRRELSDLGGVVLEPQRMAQLVGDGVLQQLARSRLRSALLGGRPAALGADDESVEDALSLAVGQAEVHAGDAGLAFENDRKRDRDDHAVSFDEQARKRRFDRLDQQAQDLLVEELEGLAHRAIERDLSGVPTARGRAVDVVDGKVGLVVKHLVGIRQVARHVDAGPAVAIDAVERINGRDLASDARQHRDMEFEIGLKQGCSDGAIASLENGHPHGPAAQRELDERPLRQRDPVDEHPRARQGKQLRRRRAQHAKVRHA